jgi:glutamate formiminotransferase/formiminotetrahydrofolate cyclodeaminase
VRDFSDEVSTDSPAPGGGSVAALAGALSASLVSMVANLAFAKTGSSGLEDAAIRAQELRARLLEAVDRDTLAFDGVMEAFRMPRRTDGERAARTEAIQRATRQAALVPLEVMRLGLEALELSLRVAREGSPSSITDAGVAGLVGHARVAGAHYNVLVNLKSLEDEAFASEARSTSGDLRARAGSAAADLDRLLAESLG